MESRCQANSIIQVEIFLIVTKSSADSQSRCLFRTSIVQLAECFWRKSIQELRSKWTRLKKGVDNAVAFYVMDEPQGQANDSIVASRLTSTCLLPIVIDGIFKVVAKIVRDTKSAIPIFHYVLSLYQCPNVRRPYDGTRT